MAYEKNKWELFNPDLTDDEQPDAFITKAKLDNIETGIEEAHKLIEAVGPGVQGPKGDKGEDGVGVSGAEINDENHLIIKLSDGNSIDVGNFIFSILFDAFIDFACFIIFRLLCFRKFR